MKTAIINFGKFTLKVTVDMREEIAPDNPYTIEILDYITESEGVVYNLRASAEGTFTWDE